MINREMTEELRESMIRHYKQEIENLIAERDKCISGTDTWYNRSADIANSTNELIQYL